MDLLFEKDLLHLYFDSKTPVSEKMRFLHLAFSNSNNRFLINKDYWESIIIEVGPNNPKLDLYQQFFTQLISESKTINVVSKTDFKKEYYAGINLLIDGYKSNKEYAECSFIVLSNCENEFLKTNHQSFYNNIKRPNKDWIYFYLAANNPNALTLRYYDFESDAEIKSFLESLYSIVNSPNIAWVFDRYRNITHSCFNYLIGKIKFHYMTLAFNKGMNRSVIKEISSKLKSSLVFSASADLIHERRFILGDLVIETDEDFDNISYNRTTWKIDAYCCKITAKKLLEKTSYFKRVN